MTLTACYVVANEADVIADSLRSLKAYVDRFVIVDSIFAANPLDATHSTDGTRAICERICAPVPLTYIESDRKLTQDEARNRYLDEVPMGEWIVSVDADEVLYVDYTEARSLFAWLQYGLDNVHALNVPILSAGVMNPGMAKDVTREQYATSPVIYSLGHAPRVFRNAPTLRYRSVAHDNGITDAQGAYLGDTPLTSKALRDSRLMLVNHHNRRTYDAYQATAIWEEAEARPDGEIYVDAMKKLAGIA